jgi:hypothetical protein
MFKTLLRKWHSYIGLGIIVPTFILSITGIILIQTKAPQSSLNTATVCDDHLWLGITSNGFVGTLNMPDHYPFPLSEVSAISCENNTLDIALKYGALYSSNKDKIRWETIPRPFSGSIRDIKRLGDDIYVRTQTEFWLFNNGKWALIQGFEPTFAQRVYEIHAGWFSGKSFQWIWLITGWLWVLLSVSGIWIFFRMTKRK